MAVKYQTIHTIYGLQRMSAAGVAGVPINLTHMAVGDGNGNPVNPREDQTQLVRERFRGKVNRVYPDPKQSNKYTAELVIPAAVGGFVMRELCAIDDAGGMFVVGNLPESYKPNISEGAYEDTVVRIDFLVTNAGIVTIMVDPNVAVVTQSWISNNVTAGTLLPGGTTGQVLRKASNADGDTEWAAAADVNVLVSTIEEEQMLVDGQTVVDLVRTTTTGLAVYIDGKRLPAIEGVDGWQPDVFEITRLALGKAYPGSRLIAVQNEPASHLDKPLQQDLNLSDVPDPAEARKHLDVYSKADADLRGKSAGDVFYTARSTAPAGSLKANGAAISRTAYATLFAAIGTIYGVGDGFNTFNLPDLRGDFVRGLDDGRGLDLDRVLGSVQQGQKGNHSHKGSSDQQGSHTHTGATDAQGNHSHGGATGAAGEHQHDSGWGERASAGPFGISRINAQGSGDSDWDNNSFLTSRAGQHSHEISADGQHSHYVETNAAGQHGHNISTDSQGQHNHYVETNAAGQHGHTITVSATGGNETRPRNIALLACIKY